MPKRAILLLAVASTVFLTFRNGICRFGLHLSICSQSTICKHACEMDLMPTLVCGGGTADDAVGEAFFASTFTAGAARGFFIGGSVWFVLLERAAVASATVLESCGSNDT